jgi:hypothetical protein
MHTCIHSHANSRELGGERKRAKERETGRERESLCARAPAKERERETLITRTSALRIPRLLRFTKERPSL